MFGSGSQYYFLHFWKCPPFDQMLDLGPLYWLQKYFIQIYKKIQNRLKIIFLQIWGSQILKMLEITCTKLFEILRTYNFQILMFANFDFWNFGILMFETLKCWCLNGNNFWNFESFIFKLWNFELLRLWKFETLKLWNFC